MPALKDLRQADALLKVLVEKRPGELRAAWDEAAGRGDKWMRLLVDGLGQIGQEGNWSSTLFPEGRGVPVATAGFWVSVYWASFTLGRFVFGIIADSVKPINATRVMIAIGGLAATLIWWNPVDLVSFLALALMGFVMAPIFPLLISTTPTRLGVRDATNAIGFQVAAASVGIAVMPGLAGAIAERTSLEAIPPFMVVATILLFVLHEVAVRKHA